VVRTHSTLPPLRWIAEEALTYNEQTHELHRPSCPQAYGYELAAGEALDLVWAPKVCPGCRPDVTLGLGC
jgi:hypothetical protein